ncbi:MAG: mandelate racemase/muconate lactonizing enzyme family protein, partial [Clostridia bacterium]|nr:mandelate racemase/muconate lactonizing enzyme family protein [Clostridia bacterium]
MADRETPRDRINTYGAPSQLRITDLRLTEIESSSMRCILLKIETNQGLVGLGEVRDGASPSYAAMLKSRLVGENPCEVERLFRRIRQFGGPSRQGGGVSGIEIALW